MSSTERALFAAGCFWGVQFYFDQIPGVRSTVVGYSGGRTVNPSYEEVCTGATGHAETVEVEFDPHVVTYETLVRHFFRLHDPTQLNQQGPDVGEQYRSAIFYTADEQKSIAESVRTELQQASDRRIVTQIVPASEFYPAEPYHQKYTERTGRGMCHVPCAIRTDQRRKVMGHIHTKPGQYDLTVSAYVIDTRGDEPRIWLHWHKKFQCWMQFGGHVELHEDPWQALEHELKEESGFALGQLQVLQPPQLIKQLSDVVVHPQPMYVISAPFMSEAHFHTDLGYAFCTQEDPVHEIAEGESGRVRLFTKAEVETLPGDEILDNVREISLHVFNDIYPNWQAL